MKTSLLLLLSSGSALLAADFPALLADYAAIELVYHEHRTGTKPPFAEAMPPAMLESLVRTDLKKEAALARSYGVKITGEMVAAEVRRIDTTTRAPEPLAKIKAALGNDPARFAEAMARPIVVERLLRDKFENDDALHAPQRQAAEALRARMLGAKDFAAPLALLKEAKDGEIQEKVRWELTPRPADEAQTAPAAAPSATTAKTTGGIYTNEATAQMAQTLSPPEKAHDEKDRKFYFEDLPAPLQNVLRVQLRQPGDVGAVIETPGAFQIYLAQTRAADSLSAAVFTLRKLDYEEWLAQQPDP